PALGIRRGARAPVDPAPPRARLLLRRGSALLVARLPGPAARTLLGAEDRLPLRRLRARSATGSPPFAVAEPDLRVLRGGPSPLGHLAVDGPADRGHHDGRRGSDRLLLPLRLVLRPLPARGGPARRVPGTHPGSHVRKPVVRC